MNNKFQVLVALAAFSLVTSLTTVTVGHHIWIAKAKDTGKVNIYFGEDPSPDQDMFLTGIKGMQVWSVDSSGVASELEFTHKTEGKNGWFETREGLSAVDVNCEYGVFGRGESNMFLHYCAKWVEYSPTAAARSTGKLPIDIELGTSGSKTVFKVLHNRKAAAGCELRIITANNDEHDLIANDSGQIVFDAIPDGRWLVKARVVVEEPGEHNGKKFSDKRFFCTMVIDAPAKAVSKKVEKTMTSGKSNPVSRLNVATPFPELPIGITSFGGAVMDDHVYVFGGHCGDAHDYYRSGQNEKLMRLNLSSPTKWEEVGESTGLQGLAMVAHNGNLYRVGGFAAHNEQGQDQDLHSVDDFARFNFESGKWQPLQAMPTPRSSMDAVVVGDTLYVVGGWIMKGKDKTKWCDNALSINLTEKGAGWQVIKTPFARRALSVGFQGDKLYAVGGMQKVGGPTTDVRVYDMVKKTWSQGPALPGEGPMAGFGNSCFNIGGRLVVSTYDGSVLRMNEDQTGWEKIHQLETGRFFHRLLPLPGDKFMLVGGANMETGKLFDVPVLSFK